MPSFYRVNVSQNGTFYFRCDLEMIPTIDKARTIARDFATRFPASEGFQVDLTSWECRGTHVGI